MKAAPVRDRQLELARVEVALADYTSADLQWAMLLRSITRTHKAIQAAWISIEQMQKKQIARRRELAQLAKQGGAS